MRFGSWLSTQRAIEAAQGIDHRDLACRPAELTKHITAHLHSASRSLERAEIVMPANDDLDEKQRAVWEEGREDFVRHAVNAIESIGYALNAVGCSDKELHSRYLANPLHMPRGGADAEDVCAECKTIVDQRGTEVRFLAGGALACGEKCAEAYNQKASSGVAPDPSSASWPAEKSNTSETQA